MKKIILAALVAGFSVSSFASAPINCQYMKNDIANSTCGATRTGAACYHGFYTTVYTVTTDAGGMHCSSNNVWFWQ